MPPSSLLRRSLPGRRVDAATHEALLRALSRIERADGDARALVEKAREEADAERERARGEGAARARGEAAGLLASAAAERDRILAGAAGEVVALALEVARKVLGRELGEPGTAALPALAGRALAAARDRRAVRVRLAPAEAAEAGTWLPPGVEVAADPALAPGECVVETPGGRIEAGIDAQLGELARALGPPASAEVAP